MLEADVPVLGRGDDTQGIEDDLEDLVAVGSFVLIAAKVSVAKSKRVTELVYESARSDGVRPENDRAAERVDRVGAGGEHRAILGEARHMLGDVDVLTTGRLPRTPVELCRGYSPDVERDGILGVTLLHVPRALDRGAEALDERRVGDVGVDRDPDHPPLLRWMNQENECDRG